MGQTYSFIDSTYEIRNAICSVQYILIHIYFNINKWMIIAKKKQLCVVFANIIHLSVLHALLDYQVAGTKNH